MASPSVTVYTTGPACARCTTTKNHLEKRGVPFSEVRIDLDADLAQALKDKGFSTAPVVHYEVPDADGPGADVWFDGYRPDSLDAIAGL